MTMPPDDALLAGLAQALATETTQACLKLATAESCTGGWVSKLLTDVAGSSAWFDRGFVTYSNEAKQAMLNVPRVLLDQYGAVSEEVVAAMTSGVLQNSQADWAVSISGIAGPDGGSQDKPVGTVWFAWQQREHEADTVRHVFPGDRDAVRRAACRMALQGFLDRLTDE